MLSTISNPCVRCGKERIVLKTWTALVGKAKLTYTDTACPDKSCQQVINDEISAQKEKREEIEARKAKDKAERAKLLAPKA
jgi:hypothetical protein